jgi:hypothetical protein
MNERAAAKQIIKQLKVTCQVTKKCADGSSAKERDLRKEADEGLQAVPELKRLKPDQAIMLALGILFVLQINIVKKLDASNADRRELIQAARQQLRNAVDEGYPAAVDAKRRGVLPI